MECHLGDRRALSPLHTCWLSRCHHLPRLWLVSSADGHVLGPVVRPERLCGMVVVELLSRPALLLISAVMPHSGFPAQLGVTGISRGWLLALSLHLTPGLRGVLWG